MNWRIPVYRRPASALLATAGLTALLAMAVASPALAGSYTAASAAAPVKTSAAHILVTTQGRTVYVFAADRKNKSVCYGQCAKFWPPVLAKKGTTPTQIGGIVGNFGVATRKDGTKQLTFDGAPLYTFAEDKKAGDMKGQGVIAGGGYWWVVATG